jgi:hypothetical protein
VSQHLGKLTGHDADLVPEWLKTSAYALLLLPLVVWILLLVYFVTQMMKAGIVYTLAKCGNLFWTIYCLFLAIMTFVISDEPLFFFHQNHPSECVLPSAACPFRVCGWGRTGHGACAVPRRDEGEISGALALLISPLASRLPLLPHRASGPGF